MQIKKTIKLDNGTYVIEGEFNPAEVEVIIEAGLNTLLQAGALPFSVDENDDDYFFVTPPHLTEQ